MKSNPARVCVPVGVRRASEMAPAISRASEFGDIVELRLDYLDEAERQTVSPVLRELLQRVSTPIVLTFRSAEQGGRTVIDAKGRQRFWTSLIDVAGPALIDLELDLVLRFAAGEPAVGRAIDWSRVICSHHDFRGVPSDLDQIYERMAATPARILKIAVQTLDVTDCLPIFGLLERAQRDGREMIAIAMGQPGIVTRILGPARGSYLTYGASTDDQATAPGQLTAKELRQIYRIDKLDRRTEVVGLIGNPVGHSVSPQIHNAAFAAAAINAVYVPFQVADAAQFLRRVAHPKSRELDWNLRGLSVTAPHKSVVMNQLDWIDAAAREIGAVNTILVTEDGLHGYNTDAAAFIRPLRRMFGSLDGVRCAVIGSGGAARAVLWALRQNGAQVVVFARAADKARELAEAFGMEHRLLSQSPFDAFDIVINATPLGTHGILEDETPATADQLRGVRLAYDLVYNPLETRFLREARAADCEMLGGIGMLVAQAIEQFKIWVGKDPNIEVMQDAAVRASGE